MDITAAVWVKKNNKLMLYVKDSSGWQYIDPGMKPYFFIRKADKDKAAKYIKTATIEDVDAYTYISNEPVVKISVDFPDEIKGLRDLLHQKGIPTYEADIPFVRRWMIDNDIHVADNPKILFFDVEADSRLGFPDPSNPQLVKQRVLSISAADENGKDWFFCDDSEEKILSDFKDLAMKYDILIGWNVERFDIPYLNYHYKLHGIKSPFDYISVIDLMTVYKELYWTGGTARLDDVAYSELGLHKTISLYEVGSSETLYQWFIKDRGKLYEYNVGDVLLLWKLFQKWDVTAGLKKLIVNVVRQGYTFYDSFYMRSKIIDSLLLREAYLSNPRVVLPTKGGKNVEEIKGALVLEPKAGIYDKVFILDFASLYPSIITSFNISPETAAEDGEIISGKLRFRKSPRGIIPKILDNFIRMRLYYKQLTKECPEVNLRQAYHALQLSLKTLINSMYGVMGHEGFRLFYPDVAESITLTGQKILQLGIEIASSKGLKVIYGDTDSLFIHAPNIPDKIFNNKDRLEEYLEGLANELNNLFRDEVIKRFNVPPEYYNLKLEVDMAFEKFYLPNVKKRYVGKPIIGGEKYILRRSSSGGYIIKGFELVRGDIPEVIKKVQSDVFDILLTSKDLREARSRVNEYLNKVKDLLFSGYLDESLIIRKTVTKYIDDYRQESVHVKAAKQLLNSGFFRPGDSIYYIITGEGDHGLKAEPVIDGKPLPKPYYKYYWERIVDAVNRIFGDERPVTSGKSADLMKWLKGG